MIQNFGNAFSKIEFFGGERALNAATEIFSAMGADNTAELLQNIDWSGSENLLADFTHQMDDLGQTLDYTTESGMALAYALAKANGQMVVTREAWKSTLSIVEKLASENAAIENSDYQHLIEQYGTAIEDYFVQMEDGTYRLIGAAGEFAQLTDDLQEKKLKEALEQEKQSILGF
jgi:hypothetical protein